MKECKNIRSQFEEFIDIDLKNELSSEKVKAFESHLENCEECSKEFNELINTLTFMKKRPAHEPDEMFMENFWDNLEPKLEIAPKKESALSVWWNSIKTTFTVMPNWSYQLAGAAAILIMGIFIGKNFIGTDIVVDPPINNNNNVMQIAVQERAEKYIDKSKMLLLGIMNVEASEDDIETISFNRTQQISKKLLSQSAALKSDLNKYSDKSMNELITDLEIILMQIANLEIEKDLTGIELIQNGVDKRGIFLKINIQEMDKQNSGNLNNNKNEKTYTNENI